MAKRFMGIHKSHVGWCTPLSNPHCTGARRRLALTLKKHHGFHKKQLGGMAGGDSDPSAMGQPSMQPTDQAAIEAAKVQQSQIPMVKRPEATAKPQMRKRTKLPKRSLRKKM